MGKLVPPRVVNRQRPALPKPGLPAVRNVDKLMEGTSPVFDTISIIERKREYLLQALEDGKPADIITADLTKVMLQAFIDLLPALERGAKESSRAVYPLEKIASLIREMSHDLRSMQDRNAMREKIMNGVIDPALLDFANKNVTELNRLARIVNDNAEAVDFIEALKTRVSALANGLHIHVANSLDNYFGGSRDASKIILDNEGADDGDYFDEPDNTELDYKSKIARRRS